MSALKKETSETKRFETIKQELMARKAELEERLTSLSQESFSDGQVQDAGDEALSSAMDNLRLSLQNSEQAELGRIEKALEMLEEGTYGICIDCERHIAEKRLQLYPNSTRCISCQELFEEQQG